MKTKIIGIIFMMLHATGAAAQSCGAAAASCEIDSGTYNVLLPDTDAPRGAVVFLHGGGGRGAGILSTNIARQSLERGFVFVAPNGEHPGARFPNNWAVRAKNFGHEKDDIAFLNDVMDDVAKRFNVDRERMLLSGFSRGGSMVWDVACFAHDSARAYAPSAGAFWDDLPQACAFVPHPWLERQDGPIRGAAVVCE